MTTLAELLVKVKLDSAEMEKGLSGLQGKLQNLGSSLESTGRKMTMGLTLPIVAAGTAIFKTGKDFESSMSKIVGLVGVSQEQVKEWEKDVLSLSKALGKSPKELADALYFITSAGLDGAEAMAVLEMSGKAAASGLGETQVIADLLTSAMNAYGVENLSAADATDILVAAVREGKADASEFAGTLGAVLPIASEMGVTFDQVAAATAAMTRTGTDAATASTQLKNIMVGLLKPSTQAEKALNDMGMSSAELRDQMGKEGLLPVLMRLKDATNEYGDDIMAQVFPNIRSLMGVLDLMGENMEDNIEIFGALENATGALDHAFETASETAEFKWQQAIASVQGVLITLWETLQVSLIPAIEKFSEKLQEFTAWWEGLSPAVQENIFKAIMLLAVLGPILIIVGKLISAISVIIGVIKSLAVVFAAIKVVAGLVGVALGALSAPVLIVIGVIAALIAIGVLLYKNWDKIKEFAIKTWDSIKEYFISNFNETKELFVNTWDSIKEFFSKWGEYILALMFGPVGIFILIVKKITENWDVITEVTAKVWDAIKKYFSELWDSIKEFFSSALNKIRDNLKESFDFFKKIISDTWDSIKKTTETIWNTVKDFLIRSWVSMKEGVAQKAVELKATVINAIEAILNWVKELPSKMLEFGKNMVMGMVNGIKQMATALLNAAIETVKKAVDAVKNFLKIKSPSEVFSGIGINCGEGMVEGLGSMQDAVQKAGQGLAEAAIPSSLESEFRNIGASAGSSLADGLNSQVSSTRAAANALSDAARVTTPAPVTSPVTTQPSSPLPTLPPGSGRLGDVLPGHITNTAQAISEGWLKDMWRGFYLGDLLSMSIVGHTRPYHDGGIVGKATGRLSGLVNDMFQLRSNEVIAKLMAGEVIVNPAKGIENLRDNILSFLKNGAMNLPNYNSVASSMSSGSSMLYTHGLATEGRNQTIIVELDGGIIAKAIADPLMDKVRIHSRSAI